MKKLKTQTLIDLKHEIVLFSLLLLLFGQLFVPASIMGLVQPILFLQTIVAGIILFSDKPLWRHFFTVLFLISMVLSVYVFFYKSTFATSVQRTIFIVIFLAISAETYRQIYTTKDVRPGMIASVLSGFILLCLISSLFFALIETGTPNSFSNLGTGSEKYQNLSYFSFITALTIGYGDIVPLTETAKKATVLIALLGNFYTVIVTGIVLGKYLSKK